MTSPAPPNPLVVEPEHEDAQPLNWEGAGAASSVADLNAALAADHVDPAQVAYTAAGAGLDVLGAVVSPLDSFAVAGIGWLIEHVWWLHEPLDALAGDPIQITAQAQTWHNVGVELGRVAGDYRGAAAALPAWDGSAGDAYRSAVERYAAALDRSAQNAVQLSDLVLTTGANVGTLRALIRDAIAEFAWEVIKWIAAAVITGGTALGAATVQVVLNALDLAEDISRRITRLLDALKAAGGTVAQISEALRDTAAQIRVAVPHVQAALAPIERTADELGLGKLVEAGKQQAAAEQNQRAWGTPAG